MTFSFEVRGRPATQGSKTLWVTPQGRRNVVEASKHLPAWRKAVRAAAWARLARDGVEGVLFGPRVPVQVQVIFRLARPKSARPGDWPTHQMDIDKLCRGAIDPLVAAGVMHDDGQVVRLVAQKQYVRPAGDEAWMPEGASIVVAAMDGAMLAPQDVGDADYREQGLLAAEAFARGESGE